jgi:hypothetical protein
LIGTATELGEWASRITGLSDFGTDDYADGLAVLLSSLESEAGLTERGERAARAMLRGALVARLLSQAGFASDPDPPPVTAPVVVTGLPRTGTTFLHRMLVADPCHQGLELWLAEAPQPRPPRAQWPDNPAYQRVLAGLARHGGLPGVHEMAAGQVEECWQLLRQSMRSISYECLAYVPSYSQWLARQDWLQPYRRHLRNLQLIGRHDAGKRWVLKNPSHLFALDALLRVYPDALVVVTHRDPLVAIASACSLSARASDGWSTVFTASVIGRTQLDLWARGWSLFRAARARHDPARFLDVAYDDLVADPAGTAERIYERLGVTLSGAAADAMRAFAAPGESSHRYSLADFGLSPADVNACF